MVGGYQPERGPQDVDYSSRLFSGGLRGYVHLARFRWLRRQLIRYRVACVSVLELGCHDGMAIDYFPRKPGRYLGFDADWADGLKTAQVRWPEYAFRFCRTPEHMELVGQRFDVAVALETLEHIEPAHLDIYLAKIAEHTGGYFFVSVPNEKGPVFLAKWIAKRFLLGGAQRYTLAEAFNATIGRMDRVPRDDHKGFDYAALIVQLSRHFKIESVSGIPLPGAALNPYVGIVARSR